MNIQDLYPIFLGSSGITIDSRKVEPGSIYFSIRGENFDGNEFAAAALAAGAEYAVVDNKEFMVEGENYIYFQDSLSALQDLARLHRKELKTHVIGISGSNGKTTSKELISRVLSTEKTCFATPGNLNNHIGLPLSILMIRQDHDFAVIELGANHPGEHEFLCSIAMPDSGIVTNIGKDHLEGYGSWDGVVQSHKEFTDHIGENNGLFFLNSDDPEIWNIISPELETITYGKKGRKELDYEGEIISRFPFLDVEIMHNDSLIIKSKLFGGFHLYNMLAAVAIGSELGISKESIIKGIENYSPGNNRSEILTWGNNRIILDAYNANPSSVELMIRELAEVKGSEKIAILGDMFELGEYTEKEHAEIKKLLFSLGIKSILVGKDFHLYGPKGDAVYLKDHSEAAKWLKENKPSNAWILIKGSRGMTMEKVLDGLDVKRKGYQT